MFRQATVYEIDAAGVRHRLFASGEASALAHLRGDRERLGRFVRILSPVLPGMRILDLGANPYLLTDALAGLGADVVASGYPTPGVTPEGPEWVEVTGDDGRVVQVPLVRFNVETDRFPFEDETFDAVVCGELIEHLPSGPDGLLYECDRVLRPGGTLLLSTPNSVSLARLIAILRGRNPEWPFSAQGIYARHNRTYTLEELDDLLIGNGFRPVLREGVTCVHERAWYGPGPVGTLKWLANVIPQRLLAAQSRRLQRWAEGLIVAAVKVEGPRRYRPGWLFGAADSVPMSAAVRHEEAA